MHAAAAWLRRRAENIAAGMLAVMFCAFVLQIVFRYALNLPTGWATELTVVMWLWLVLWGSAFVVGHRDEIRFDLLVTAAGRRTRITMGLIGSVALIVLYLVSLPASFDYVAFMKVESTSYLKIRIDWLYSIYIVFLLAVVARNLWVVARLMRGEDDLAPPPEPDGAPGRSRQGEAGASSDTSRRGAPR
jgi:C4-dicarboxylate transporter, DctQ subunit